MSPKLNSFLDYTKNLFILSTESNKENVLRCISRNNAQVLTDATIPTLMNIPPVCSTHYQPQN